MKPQRLVTDTMTECRILLSESVDQAMLGRLESAKVLLDEAWGKAGFAWERTECHDVGNYIQRQILSRYLETSGGV